MDMVSRVQDTGNYICTGIPTFIYIKTGFHNNNNNSIPSCHMPVCL